MISYTSLVCLVMAIMFYAIVLFAGDYVVPPAAGNPDGGWAAWLQTYGGWGVSVLLITMFISFYRDTRKDFQDRQQKFETIQRDATATMQSIASNQIFLNNTLQNVQKALETSTQLIQQQANLLERANNAIGRCENKNLRGQR